MFPQKNSVPVIRSRRGQVLSIVSGGVLLAGIVAYLLQGGGEPVVSTDGGQPSASLTGLRVPTPLPEPTDLAPLESTPATVEPTHTPGEGVEGGDPDAAMFAKLVGTWQGQFHGKQTITLRPDGTAQLESQLDFFSSLLYGDKLSMELTWTVKSGVLTQKIISGTPEKNVARLIANEGDTRVYNILEHAEQTFLLAEADDPADTIRWNRVSR